MIETHPRTFAALLLALILLALSCALFAPPLHAASLELHATLTTNGGAVVTWQQPEATQGLTCLYHNKTLYTCWDDLPPGSIRVTIGGPGGLDASQRPSFGSEYVLRQDNVTVGRARVRGPVWMPMVGG